VSSAREHKTAHTESQSAFFIQSVARVRNSSERIKRFRATAIAEQGAGYDRPNRCAFWVTSLSLGGVTALALGFIHIGITPLVLELAGEVLGGVLRFIGSILLQVVFEILIRGVGYFICRPFKRKIHPDSITVGVVGIIFWVGVGGVVYAIHRQMQ
jgi:hypothetical protein